MNIELVRDQFPALQNYGWFQNGGVSITPRVVHNELVARMEELLARGPMHIIYPDEEHPRRDESRQVLADFFATSPARIGFVRGVSEAFQAVLCGIEWQAGDCIVITEDEEAALLLPALHLQQQKGVRVERMKLGLSSEEQIVALNQLFDQNNVRLLAISHVTTDVGFRFDASALCQLAREHGVLSFVDMAHSAGLFPIHLDDFACDFAGVLSYKWMYGPYAAGFLYAREGVAETLTVPFAGGRGEKMLNFEALEYELAAGPRRFEWGPWCWPLIHGWATAAEYLKTQDLGAIWARTRQLVDRLREGLAENQRVTLFTPADESASASLVALAVDGWTGDNLAAELRTRFNLIVKALPHTREGLRISLPFFLLEEEVEQLVKAINEVS